MSRFEKLEDEYGEAVDFTFEGEVGPEVEDLRQPVALAFDARYTYDETGTPIEVIWLESDTAMALEEAGVIELVGSSQDEIPQPVRAGDLLVYLYKIVGAS